MSALPDWVREFPGSITVCDAQGTILLLNQRACRTFEKEGGAALVGRNVLDCHPEPARTELRGMLESGRGNAYTIEKRGVRKLIYQSPWYEAGVYRGFVELSLEIPESMPHFVRK
jgi:PAS domain-containing protein